MSIPRKVTDGWISGHGRGSKKEKKDAEQCSKRFCLKTINYFINKQIYSSTTKIISNVPICTITVSSKSRKNSIELTIQAIL